jgi:hypothetical protein
MIEHKEYTTFRPFDHAAITGYRRISTTRRLDEPKGRG